MNKNLNDATSTKPRDANPDPLTGEHGAHPVGVGTGAAGGGAAGAAIGAVVGGPIGGAVGAVVGAVSGGLAGKGVAEKINPTAEHEYWREEYKARPYVKPGSPYDEYAPAYEYGWESYSRCAPKNRTFGEVEPELARDWETKRGPSRLHWDDAKPATRDAWERASNCCKGC